MQEHNVEEMLTNEVRLYGSYEEVAMEVTVAKDDSLQDSEQICLLKKRCKELESRFTRKRFLNSMGSFVHLQTTSY